MEDLDSSKIFHFAHISLYVKDMDVAIEFYTKVLGLKLLRRRKETVRDKAERAFLASNDNTYRVELTLPKDQKDKPDKLDHIAFYVDNMEEAVNLIKMHDVPLIDGPYDVPTSKIKVAFIKDYEGTLIELIEKID
ncbi:MAG: VOC family protein [Nitrososphaeria archaeon]|nr:VOC family protein [Nitrososphaeria archaeon]